MSIRYLGEQLDIHGGGGDLVYPHHESEIAQSECWSGKRPFARFWMHVGMLRMDGEKMSKSLGNMVFVRDLLERHSPESVRLYLLGVHYRGILDYSPDDIRRTQDRVDRLRQAATVSDRSASDGSLDPAACRAHFLAAMDDDLDTPSAIAALCELGEAIFEARDQGRKVDAAQSELGTLARILGIEL
jgi:L-cysteine:1D-myo-inositol 2-amino-2-deoxy-alpha-D-glucopyranoside ligase